MKLHLPPEEPACPSWRVVSLEALAKRVLEGASLRSVKPHIVAIDGRSSGGKTTLATRLNEVLPDSVVVHTDDIAWHHSFFDWTELLLEEVLKPARAGRAVAYRPSAWQERNREGAITVPPGCETILLEGVGAARRELIPVIDTVIWIQTDMTKARARWGR